MRITFDVGGKPTKFHWNPVTGATTLTVDGDPQRLQSGLDPRSHYNVSTVRKWRRDVDGHDIVITMSRPRIVAGLRPKDFTVDVDGQTVQTAHGY